MKKGFCCDEAAIAWNKGINTTLYLPDPKNPSRNKPYCSFCGRNPHTFEVVKKLNEDSKK